MNEIESGFDYSSLNEGTRVEVQLRTAEINDLVRHCTEDMFHIGLKLFEVKLLLGHGNFLSWLEKEFPLSTRTAEKLMRTAQVFKFEDFSNLLIGISALNLIAARSTPVEARDEVLNLARTDEGVNYEEANNIVNKHKGNGPFNTSDGLVSFPQGVLNLLKEGRIGLPFANQIMRLLQVTNNKTQLLVSRWGLSDPDLVPELDRLNKEGRETFDVVFRTGAIPSPRGSIPINQATLRDLADYLNQASFEHAMAGIEAKKERDQATLKRKLEKLRGDSTDIGIIKELNDLAFTSDECVVLYSPGDHSPRTLGNLLEKWGYQHLAVLIFKGDPPVNSDGKLVPASKATYRIPKLARGLLEEFCDLAQLRLLIQEK